MKKLCLIFSVIMMTAMILSSCDDSIIESEIDYFPLIKDKGRFITLVNKDDNSNIIAGSHADIFREGLSLTYNMSSFDDENMLFDEYGVLRTRCSYIDKESNVVTNEFKRGTYFNNGLAWVVEVDSVPKAINKKGEVKIILDDAIMVKSFSEMLSAFSVKNSVNDSEPWYERGQVDFEKVAEKWGFVDTNGNIVIEPRFYSVGDFSEGLCSVMSYNGKWGFIDKTGKIIINPKFDRVFRFEKGMAVVSINDKFGVINEKGEIIINPIYDFIKPDGNLFLVLKNEKWGWIDNENNNFINIQYDFAFGFNGSKLAPIKLADKWGYINKEDELIISNQYDFAFPYIGDLAPVSSNDNIGFIDKEGTYKILPDYDFKNNFDFILNIYSDYYDFFRLMDGNRIIKNGWDLQKIKYDHLISRNDELYDLEYKTVLTDKFNYKTLLDNLYNNITLSKKTYTPSGFKEFKKLSDSQFFPLYKNNRVRDIYDNYKFEVLDSKIYNGSIRDNQIDFKMHITGYPFFGDTPFQSREELLARFDPDGKIGFEFEFDFSSTKFLDVFMFNEQFLASLPDSFKESYKTPQKNGNAYNYYLISKEEELEIKITFSNDYFQIRTNKIENESNFKIQILSNKNNINVRKTPVDGDVVAKVSGGEIYSVAKKFKSETPLYLLNKKMILTDGLNGERIEKPKNFKLNNVQSIDDYTYYAEVENMDKTINKVRVKKTDVEISYSNWYYLSELDAWIYSEFCEKLN